MDIVDINNKKRLNKEPLTYDEISYAVNAYVKGEIKDYQMSALLMAICINGMNEEETVNLTKIMIDTGDKIDLSSVEGVKVDKHSTGGVGDKTTLIVAPLVASCGVIVPKMSGRGLGHTGGTIDKLESIPGFKVSLTTEEFINQLKDIGVAISSTSLDLVPADKKIYALRDVTGTVSSPALMAASIMSKKIATGADKIVLDVKTGAGALIPTKEKAIELAKIMVKIGTEFNKETVAIITNMDYPLGNNVGNALEVLESIDVLKGKVNNSLTELCIVLASHMVSIGKNIDYEEAKRLVGNNLSNGKAYEKFKELVAYQHGDIEAIKVSNNIVEIKSIEEGYINAIDALAIGHLSMSLGAGRKEINDVIDPTVGIALTKTVGDYVKIDDVIAKIYLDQKNINSEDVNKAFTISPEQNQEEQLIYDIVK